MLAILGLANAVAALDAGAIPVRTTVAAAPEPELSFDSPWLGPRFRYELVRGDLDGRPLTFGILPPKSGSDRAIVGFHRLVFTSSTIARPHDTRVADVLTPVQAAFASNKIYTQVPAEHFSALVHEILSLRVRTYNGN